jgi:UDP-4-amino-4-deoxy-L-arabinose-oxoglutarate aminotransferase
MSNGATDASQTRFCGNIILYFNLMSFTRRAEFLPFSRPDISEAEIADVVDVLRSGWITTGAKCAAFESAFAAYCGIGDAVALASATAGMHVALEALGIAPGDEIITPSLTWVSTPNLAILRGAKPVFVDVDKSTLLMRPDAVEAAITPRTKAIIPVHYAGVPADMDALRTIARKHQITMIEDAAHAAGTEYKKQKIGSWGTAIFSFHPIKNMTTGEGGMVTSDDAEFLESVRRFKFHGLGVDAFDRANQGRSPQAEVLEPGYKYNLTDIAAALGLGQLARLDAFIEKRATLAKLYAELFAEIPEILPLGFPDYDFRHAWHLYIVRINTDRISRNEFMTKLKELNIGTGLHFRAVHGQKYFRENPDKSTFTDLPNTEWNSDRICSLPLFPAMQESDVQDVVNTVKEVLV